MTVRVLKFGLKMNALFTIFLANPIFIEANLTPTDARFTLSEDVKPASLLLELASHFLRPTLHLLRPEASLKPLGAGLTQYLVIIIIIIILLIIVIIIMMRRQAGGGWATCRRLPDAAQPLHQH